MTNLSQTMMITRVPTCSNTRQQWSILMGSRTTAGRCFRSSSWPRFWSCQLQSQCLPIFLDLRLRCCLSCKSRVLDVSPPICTPSQLKLRLTSSNKSPTKYSAFSSITAIKLKDKNLKMPQSVFQNCLTQKIKISKPCASSYGIWSQTPMIPSRLPTSWPVWCRPLDISHLTAIWRMKVTPMYTCLRLYVQCFRLPTMVTSITKH